MLLLPTKQTDKIDLFTPLLRNIRDTSGAQFSEQAKPALQKLQALRNDLTDIAAIRNNSSAVSKVAEQIKDYLGMWNCIARGFTFGGDKESVNVAFTWYDAYTREKRTCTNPMAERIGMLYNLGIMYSQMGMDAASLPGDKVKEAATLFLTAAWVFERIKLDLVNLKLSEFTGDVSEGNLGMCSFLMKAQAQVCVYEKLRAAHPDRVDLLAKLAMQAAKDYEVACGYSKVVGLEKTPNGRNLLGVMQFKEGAYRTNAYYWSALDQKKKCEESVTGMGKAVASIRKAMEHLDSLRKAEKTFPPEVVAEYKTLSDHCAEAKRVIESLNNKLYHESVPSRPAEVDAMPYGKPISIEKELDRPFEGKDVLSSKTPAGVRKLYEEYKKQVGAIIQEEFEVIREVEEQQTQVLKKHNLPNAIHAVSNDQNIPEDMWQRIRKCKENGGIQGLEQSVEGVEDLAKCNEDNMLSICNQLKAEEKEDHELKQKYGSQWTRMPSASLNTNMTKQLEHFRQKYDTARQTDADVRNFVHSSKGQFDLLELDRDSLTSKIPKGSSGSEELSPAAAKYFGGQW